MIFSLRINTYNSNGETKKITTFFLYFILTFILTIALSSSVMAQTNFPRSELSIKTEDNVYDFQIELALDDTHRQYGMMFRNSMDDMSGMLFVYDEKQRLSMWMRNTFISLDILFIDEGGEIMRIAHSRQPRSISLIRSGSAAKAVLELKGGIAKSLGIEEGDVIIHSTFENISK